MVTDYKTIQRGVKALSYARSQLHCICGMIRQDLQSANVYNSGGKFKRCGAKINAIVDKMEQNAVTLTEIGQKLEQLAYYVYYLEE